MTQPPRRRARPKAVLSGLLSAALAVGAVLAFGGPAATAEAAQSTTHGLKGEYFLSSGAGTDDLATLKATRLDAAVNFADLNPAYLELTGRNTDTAARWTGQIQPEFTENYTFYAIGDNGFRVWIDGALVIDHWQKDWDNEQTSAAVALTAGERYDIKVEQFQEAGGSNMYLRWSSPSVAKQIIPATAYYAPEGFPAFSLNSEVSADGLSVAVAADQDLAGIDDAFLAHLQVKVDGQAYPLDSLTSVDARHFEISMGTAIARDGVPRLSYDGGAAVSYAGAPVEAFDLPIINLSTYTMSTEWSALVDKNNPLPEYPRPQLVRDEWANLNGQWEFAGADADEAIPTGQTLDETITVPYPIESVLSGIERHEDHMFYKRTIDVPADWNIGSDNRLRLNFGAVDYQSSIYLNGQKVGENTGGYLPFSVDLTDALVAGSAQELIVAVTDTTGKDQPVGKQRANPSGIFYTPTSGIWQTVWMEPVPETAIDDVVATPDLKAGLVNVDVASASASATDEVTVTVRAKEDGAVVGTATGAAGTQIPVAVPDAHLWSPEDPYLYDLDVSITGGDSAESYFGMRSVEISEVGGVQKIVLNGKPEFLLATLDQGYWPESQYTQPTDDALKFDIQKTKDLAFNTIRKHIKVESARFYYYADTIGLMVWQDTIPGDGKMTTPAAEDAFVESMHDMVDALKGWTSIIGWTVFNEGWSEWDTAETGVITDSIKAQDPTRLVNARSGLNCCELPGDSGRGDVIDWHVYQGPGFPAPDATRAAVDGEHGGLSLVIPGHTWKGAFSPYGGFETSEALTAAYVANTEKMIEPARTFMSGAVYTQISDVEGEVNGFYTYDRRIEKMDLAQVTAVNQRVLDAGRLAGTTAPAAGVVGDAAYPLDEATGTTSVDASGHGHDLTLSDGAGWTDGVSGSALQLSGDGQYAATSGTVVDTSKDYTVSATVKLDKIPGAWASAVAQEGGTGRSSFFLQYGGGGFAFSTPDARALTPVVPTLGTWYQLTGVFDVETQELRLYVDGVLKATQKTGSQTSVGRLIVGGAQWENKLVDFWPGAIDNVHVYGRALSDAEIARVAAGDTGGAVLTPASPSVKQGETLAIAGSALTPGIELTASVDGVEIGTSTPDAAGTADWSWTVGADVAIGIHTIVVSDVNGEIARADVEVTEGDVVIPAPAVTITGTGGGAVRQAAAADIEGSGFEEGAVLTALVDAEAVAAPSSLAGVAAAPVAVGADTVVIGEATVAADGAVNWDWTVPVGFALGAHTLSVTSAEGDELASVGFTVLAAASDPGSGPGAGGQPGTGAGSGPDGGTGAGSGSGNGRADGTIASTGLAIGGTVVGALALLLFGTLGVLAVRRRRAAE
ncbi:glycoside hydrolase family 2 [Clavibacter michiganensis]|nr:LamG-like jellyroll fold domain-containing protein [Clavibacter michiganensis]PPF64969.1 glycoside hydrolase family 2 [Clavibacter michiganensis]